MIYLTYYLFLEVATSAFTLDFLCTSCLQGILWDLVKIFHKSINGSMKHGIQKIDEHGLGTMEMMNHLNYITFP